MYSKSDEVNMSTKSYTIGSYLLNTVWDQGSGYQEQCPIDPLTQQTSKVGCGGVALGQILHYWGCKVFPDGYVSYLPPNFQNNISIYFYNQTYNWSAMDVDSPDNENKKLLYHCAVSLESKFGFNGTSHEINGVPFSFWNYWGFNSETVKYKNDYISTWTSLLRNEIDNGRPIYYGGTDVTVSPNKAHVWVVDGYRTSDNTYHCNWGWGGNYNEWFTLTDLTPDTWNLNSSQLAVMGIYPKLDACSGLAGESLICYPDTVQYSVTIPSTASISWSITGDLSPVGVTTNPTFNVRSTSNSGASGTITATIKNSQDQTFLTRTKSVWIGAPVINNINGPMSTPNNEWANYEAILESELSAPTVYNWILNPLNSNIIYNYGWNADIAFYNSGTYQLIVQAKNQCSQPNFGTYYVATGLEVYDSRSLSISPNPADGETIVTIGSESVAKTAGITEEWDLEVYTQNQILKEKKTKLIGKSTKINTSGWQEGVYIVRVKYKDEILTDKLVVKK